MVPSEFQESCLSFNFRGIVDARLRRGGVGRVCEARLALTAIVRPRAFLFFSGGGPSGACAAEIFAQEPNIETYLIERKMDNAKPCGGAIPLCMIGEFDIPESVVDRKVGSCIWVASPLGGCLLPTRQGSLFGSLLSAPKYSPSLLSFCACSFLVSRFSFLASRFSLLLRLPYPSLPSPPFPPIPCPSPALARFER